MSNNFDDNAVNWIKLPLSWQDSTYNAHARYQHCSGSRVIGVRLRPYYLCFDKNFSKSRVRSTVSSVIR